MIKVSSFLTIGKGGIPAVGLLVSPEVPWVSGWVVAGGSPKGHVTWDGTCTLITFRCLNP